MKYVNVIVSFLQSLVRPYALRDWYITLTLSAIVLVVLIGMSVHFFFGIRSGTIATPPAPETVRMPNVSRDKLQDVVSTFETKQVNYDAGNIELSTLPDPS